MVCGYLIYVLIQKLQFQKINFLQNLYTLNLKLLILEKNIFHEVYYKNIWETMSLSVLKH